MNRPQVSVILPTYNCPQYIGQAIESILAQTYGDFELVVIDDGSSDETPEIARGFHDLRMRVLPQTNHGLPWTLNRGIGLARGRYIARQDQDDFSDSMRLEKQVAFLDSHRRCALVGTWAEIWHDQEKTGRVHRHPTESVDLKYRLLLDNPFVHSSVMMRKDALARVGGYATDPMRQPPEDFELWSRLAREFDVANLPEVLHAYREVSTSMSRSGPAPFLNRIVTIAGENIAWAAGLEAADPRPTTIAALAHGTYERVTRPPDFVSLRNVMRQAVGRISLDEVERLQSDSDGLMDGLESRWLEFARSDDWRWRVVRAVHGAARRTSGQVANLVGRDR